TVSKGRVVMMGSSVITIHSDSLSQLGIGAGLAAGQKAAQLGQPMPMPKIIDGVGREARRLEPKVARDAGQLTGAADREVVEPMSSQRRARQKLLEKQRRAAQV